MSFKSVFSAGAILVGSGVALLTGGIAKAEPALPVPSPNVPGIAVVEQLADPVKAAQTLQNAADAASMLTGTPAKAATPAAPTTPPLASASLNVPQNVPWLPSTSTTPATQAIPGSTVPGSVVPGSTATPASTPGAEVTLPQVPGLPVPLPQKLSFPGDLGSLLPGLAPSMTPQQAAAAAAGSPSAAAPSTAPTLASLFPTNALP